MDLRLKESDVEKRSFTTWIRTNKENSISGLAVLNSIVENILTSLIVCGSLSGELLFSTYLFGYQLDY